MIFSSPRQRGGASAPEAGRIHFARPNQKNGAPARRRRVGRLITVTSQDGVTEFVFTLTLA